MNLEPVADPDQNNTENQTPPSAVGHHIFREEALQHYVHNEQRVELPASFSRASFIYLWILSLVLVIFGLVIAFWPLIRQW